MTESIFEFGPGRRLIGVLTKPAGDPTRDIAVVITNSGIIHRVGANRLHVRLARTLAAQGYPCLRYDLPGIGDSERLGISASPVEENCAATAAAFDALQAAGVARSFVMVGLCSGADHSLMMTCTDSRIVGAVLIDPTSSFSTPRHRVNQMLLPVRRGLRPRVLWRLATGQYSISRSIRESGAELSRPGAPRSLTRPEHEGIWTQTLAAFRSLIDRRVQLNMVITGHNKRVYSYASQIFDAFPDLPGLRDILRVEHRPGAEHTFDAEADRRFLEDAIVDWLNTTMAGGDGIRGSRQDSNAHQYRSTATRDHETTGR